MRLFVGVEPSRQVRDAAASVTAELRRTLDACDRGRVFRWVPAENLHLTIWFLGEVSETRATSILEALGPPVPEPPFALHFAGLGTFPPSGAPRVVWMGVAEGLPALARLNEEVGRRLAPWGFTAESRPYSAHLTLARVRDAPSPAVRKVLREAIARSTADAGGCRIDHLTVFRSRTSPSGARYEPLLRVPLS